MRRTATRPAAALLALVLFAAACGDDDDAATTAQPATEPAGDAAAGSADTPAMEDGDGEPAGELTGDGVMGTTEMGDAGDEHDHGDGLEVPDGMAVPEVSIDIQPDPNRGQNLQVMLVDFSIAPERASTEPVDGEGHLHLYVDGERQMRFYNQWLHLELPPGEHLVEVEVSANNHTPYTVDGERIVGSAVVVVPETEEAPGHIRTDPIDVEGDPPVVRATVTEDPTSGWNLHVELSDFTLAPQHASAEPVQGEGHLHLSIDGEKIGRLYGNWWHIPALTEGDHEILVELSANDHSPYAVDGEPVAASTTVTVGPDRASQPAGGLDDDHHDEDAGHDTDEMGGMGDDSAAMADVVIEVGFDGETVTVDEDRVDVERDDTVALVVTADVADHVHVHGYDLFADVTPGETATLTFEADIPGVFEIEFEDSGRFIAELAVQ